MAGAKGKGTMPYKTRITVKNTKNTYGDGQRAPMANPTKGRVLLDGNGRAGKQEGS